MQLLKDKIRKKMSEKHLGKNVIGAVAFNVVKRYLKTNFPTKNIEDTMIGYVRFNKLFVKTNDQELKIFIYKKKQEILSNANESLAKLGYKTKLIEIFFK